MGTVIEIVKKRLTLMTKTKTLIRMSKTTIYAAAERWVAEESVTLSAHALKAYSEERDRKKSGSAAVETSPKPKRKK